MSLFQVELALRQATSKSHTPLYKLHFVLGSLLFSDHPYLDMQVIQIHIKHILPCTQKSNMHMVRNSILM